MVTAKCVRGVLSGLDHIGHWPTNSSVIPPLGTEMVPYQSKQKPEPTKKKDQILKKSYSCVSDFVPFFCYLLPNCVSRLVWTDPADHGNYEEKQWPRWVMGLLRGTRKHRNMGFGLSMVFVVVSISLSLLLLSYRFCWTILLPLWWMQALRRLMPSPCVCYTVALSAE